MHEGNQSAQPGNDRIEQVLDGKGGVVLAAEQREAATLLTRGSRPRVTYWYTQRDETIGSVRDIPDPGTGSRHVEVDKCHWPSLSEDHVVRSYIVMTDNLDSSRRHGLLPTRILRSDEIGGGVV